MQGEITSNPASFMETEKINKLLKQHFGTHDDGRPLFRVAWSDTQFETRFGTFSEFYGSIFLREYIGVAKDKLKYPWIKNRWILEKLTFPAKRYQYWTPEIIGVENGSYEIVWTFELDGKYQAPEWIAAKYIVRSIFFGAQKISQAELDRMEQLADDKAVQSDMELMDNNSPVLPGQLHDGSAIVVP